MLGDRRLSFAVEFDQLCIKPQLRRAEANQFLEELEGLLLRETIEELVAGKHYRCDTANAEARKDGSLAYKITRICLVPYTSRA